ncbi:hypothetical protein A8924_3873 [Saccharopolyspora erythraea NRRL 2338]|uniref:Uncharacterized protein n=3 Tax=Saccharopolyspora erythraea TaxID=1836 RepID=A4FFD0_SACEN|nr:hypothetical protein A8924_3873 [Saccharopolyspora erythraea NRRL 2338]CAM02755.1 hypothetical protein SACE_3481 [Saccharopolyspora erythraea NRRL 2338]
MRYNGVMADIDVSSLQPGQSESNESGERMGRSAGGHLVQLRKRVSEPGFVVTADVESRPEAPSEVITHEWASANVAFERLMREC